MSARASAREHLPLGRPQEDGERRGPGAEQRDDLRPLLATGGRLGLGDLREIDGARAPGRDPLELLADVRADARAERVELVLLLDAVVRDDELASSSPRRRACGASSRRAARGAGSGRRCRAASPRRRSRAPDGAPGASSSTRSAPTRRRRKSASVRRCGSSSAVDVADADDEVDEGLVGASPVDRQRRDARADDDREREEALADDLAQRLEAADPFADALEPAVGTDRVQRELFASVRHDRPSSLSAEPGAPKLFHGSAATHTGRHAAGRSRTRARLRPVTAHGLDPAPLAAHGVRRDGQRWSIPMWQREKSYFTGSTGSKRARPRVISSAVFQERSFRRGEAEVPRELVDVRVDRAEEDAAGRPPSRGRGRRRRRGGPSSAGRGGAASSRSRRAGRGGGGPGRVGLLVRRRREDRPASRIAPAKRGEGVAEVPAAARSRAKRRPSDPCARWTRRAPMSSRASPRRERRGAPSRASRAKTRSGSSAVTRRARSEAGERVLELRADGLHVAEGDGRREEADELLVERVRVVVHEADRVPGATRLDVAAAPHVVQGALERGVRLQERAPVNGFIARTTEVTSSSAPSARSIAAFTASSPPARSTPSSP